ncbi:unnamed protein product [Macrosiphum euphorbiae]|uniref:Pre-C2HC domain-containing protein n=1 Tax=Macrosiphum euphorbiae TaxID=13131 RepID=A0AAV0VIA8_9HEMI|nr:unnamed protein product [Macrosiphum euphorbiae]
MAHRGAGKNNNKRTATPPSYDTVKKGRPQTYSPPPLRINTVQNAKTKATQNTNKNQAANAMQKTSTLSSKSSPHKQQNKATTENNTNDKQSLPTTSEDEDEEDDINSTHSTSSQPHKINPKIPPIMLKGADWRKVAGKLMTTIPENSLEAKLFGPESIKIQCHDIELFRIVQKYLTTTGTAFHTFSLPEEKTLKIVIKGLLREISETEVLNELVQLGFTATNVRQFGKNDQKLPIHMVVLKNSPENKGIFNLRSMFYMAVKIERYKSNTPAQCYNCQKFGHSSVHCGSAPRCVKCAGNHKAKDCTKPSDEKPKCTNCEGEHTANYRKCPAFSQETEKRRPVNRNIIGQYTLSNLPSSTQTTQLNVNTPNLINSNMSYAERTKPRDNEIIKPILDQLENLVAVISSGNTEVQTIISTIVALLPLLLNLLNQL